MQKLLLILLSLLVVVSCAGEEEVVETVPDSGGGTIEREAVDMASIPMPTSLEDRFAYVYGYQMSQALEEALQSGSSRYIALGAMDYTSGETIYSEEEMNAIAQEFQSEVYRRAEAMFRSTSEDNLSRAEAFLASNGERGSVVSISAQIEFEVLREGAEGGKSPTATSLVTVSYSLVTLDGQESGGESVQLNLANTIPGFRTVLTHMSEGERVRAWIHPDQGYGQFGNGNIGPNQLLIFDIELISVDG